jgi:hypothetical protein
MKIKYIHSNTKDEIIFKSIHLLAKFIVLPVALGKYLVNKPVSSFYAD